MNELTVLCEGPTEVGFVARVLKPHLAQFGVFVRQSVGLRNRNFGVVPYEKLYGDWQRSVGKLRSHQFLTCMIDLYSLPDYPGQSEPYTSKLEHVRCIEAAMAAQMRSTQWIPYIQLHEFESLVFVDLDALSDQFPGTDLTVGLRDLRSEIGAMQAEEIDEGPTTAPSKRLLRHIPNYAKATTGPAVLEAIGMARLKAACPHFCEWVERLESLGQN